MTFQTHTVSVQGQAVCFYTAGTHGAPVVLLHGGGTDAALLSWRLTLPVLAATHRV